MVFRSDLLVKEQARVNTRPIRRYSRAIALQGLPVIPESLSAILTRVLTEINWAAKAV